MSLILDALKRSEAERQRQTNPTLLQLHVTSPRRRLPLWGALLAALLLVNAGLLVWYAARRATPRTPAAAASSAAVPAASAASRAARASHGLRAASLVKGPAAVPGAREPAASAAAPTPVATDQAIAVNPADLEPAVPPAAARTPASPRPNAAPAVAPQPVSGGREAEGAVDYSSLPTLAELGGNLPTLHLDLHVYSPVPDQRYALINMHRVQEGDVLPEGPQVIAITPTAVVLDYRGRKFRLLP